MKTLALALTAASCLLAKTEVVALPGNSPIVNFRIVFRTGAASDPAGRPGTAALTAAMLAGGGTRDMTYKQIVDALFPMAASISAQADKEMTVFTGVTHVDNLEAFYRIFRAAILEPGWRPDDLQRLRDDTVNYLRVSLRGNNDEELGKEVLYNQIYAGHPYGFHDAGTVSAVKSLAMSDLEKFYRENYTQANLIIGLAGGYPKGFPDRVKADFERLPAGAGKPLQLPQPGPLQATQVTMIEKQTRSVAYSIGCPIEVRRGHPDFPALLVAQAYLGQHRIGGRLYERIRQARGLNYGDYAYLEYFPRGMFQLEPDPNLARSQQIFQVWIRPVEPPTAHFTLRLAMFELDRFVRDGLRETNFREARNFVTKYVNLLTKTKDAELGYAIDSLVYGIPPYTSYIKDSLARLTREDVNQAIRRHIRAGRLAIVVVANGCEGLKQKFLSEEPSPMKYNSPKPEELTGEDKIVERLKLGFKPENIRIVPVDKVLE
jgi:zinc protease